MKLNGRNAFHTALVIAALVFSHGAAAVKCDVNSDGVIDRTDITLIAAARGQLATGASDPRDADNDGYITVTDARVCSQRCTRAACGTANLPPTANAGANQSVTVGTIVTLNGAASSDPEGSPLTYAWSFTSRPAGSAATLSNAADPTPTFTVDVAGTYIVSLVVRDSQNAASAPSTVHVSTSNSAPVANAGPNQTVHAGRAVALNGTGSTDPDGDAITYAWTLTSRPPGSGAALTGAATVNPSFIADVVGTYVARLVVNDGHLNSAPSTVTISTTDTVPVANAGPNQSYFVGETATLNGAASSDADGDPLTYSWSLTFRPPGSAAALSDSSLVNPTLAIDKAGSYIAQLIVNDGFANSAPSTVTLSTRNSPPVANAGPSQTGTINQTITLDASASSDVDGDALTYAWSLITRPAGSTAALINPATIHPTFKIEVAGTYVAQLVVNDGTVNSTAATATISTSNQAPTANAGAAQSIALGATAQLDGSASSDPEHQALTFAWSLLSKPATSAALLSSSTTVNPTFIADKAGSYVAQLIVTDPGSLSSAPSSVTISTTNSQPIANAGPNQAVSGGATVQLNGSASYDPDGTALHYAWSFTSKPAGSTATFSNGSIVNPTFVADKKGTYVAQLIVDDGSLLSTPSTATITVNNTAPVANGDSYTTALNTPLVVGAPGVLGNDSDFDGDALTTVLVTNVAHGTLVLNANGSFTYTPTTAFSGTDSFTYRGNDGTVSGNLGTVTIAISSGTITLTLQSTLAAVNQTINGSILLSQAAPVGGMVVNLSSSPTSVATVAPASVTIAQGQTTGAFSVKGVAVGNATITGSASGFASGTVGITVTSKVITVGNVNVGPGATQGFPVTLSSPAPAGGLVVTLTSGNTGVVTVPATVAIAAGTSAASPNPIATAHGLGATTITATASGYASGSDTATVALTGTLSPNPLSVAQSSTVNVTLTLSQVAPTGGLTVNLLIDNTAFATVPASITIAQGNLTGQIPITGVAPGTTTLHVSGTGLTATSDAVTVTPAPPITIGATTIGKNLEQPISVSLGAPAPAGNLIVTLTSSDSTKLLLSNSATAAGSPSITVTISAGSSSPGTPVYAQSLVASGTATVTATASSYANSAGVMTFEPSGFFFGGYYGYGGGGNNFSTSQLSPPTDLNICLSSLDASTLTPDNSHSQIRGGLTVNLALTSSNTAVGTIANTPFSYSAATGNCVTSSGPQFHPVGAGSSVLAITTPSGFSTSSQYQSITATVTSAAITVYPATIGKDLEGLVYVSLDAPAPVGGVVVTLTSSDASKLLLATGDTNGTTAGTASIQVSMPEGYTSDYFYAQSLVASGTAAVTASASGYGNGSGTMTFEPSGFYFASQYSGGSSFSTTQLSPPQNLTVCASSLDPTTLGYDFRSIQIRGGLTVNLALTSSNAAVGTILNTPYSFNGGDQCDVTTPQLQFDPVGAGFSTLAITTPSGFSTPSDFQSITATVTAAGIGVDAGTIGKNLERQSFVNLDAPAPVGGVVVTLTSSDSSKLLLATSNTNGTTSGTHTIQISIPEGYTSDYFYAQSLAASGTVSVTATAPGYVNGSGNMTLEPSGFIFNPFYSGGSDFSTTAGTGDSTVTVCATSLDPVTLNHDFQSSQIRGGLTVDVSVTSSNTVVGTIVNTPVTYQGGSSCTFESPPYLGFRPLTAGTSTLRVVPPAGFNTPSDDQSITATVD